MIKIFFAIIIFSYMSIPIFGQLKDSKNKSTFSTAAIVDEKDLFPEGITFDKRTNLIFLSSLSKNKVIAIDKHGKQANFVEPKQDGILRTLGMKVDEKRRRLWILSNNKWDDSVISAIHIYNIDSKKLINKIFTKESTIPTFNDLIITKEGSAYISDWRGNSIYYVPKDLSKVEIFLKSDSLLAGANGLALSIDESILYVASHTKGIVSVDLKTKMIKPILNRTSIGDNAIDGLMIYKNSFIGICNGENDISNHYIAKYNLNKDHSEIISASIIDVNNPLFSTPTTGFINKQYLFCLAATNLHLFNPNNQPDTKKLSRIIILKYNLE